MPSFDIVKESNPVRSFRVASVEGMFDLPSTKIVEHFKGSISIESLDWNIGVIFGNSGTGKSTIAKHLFPDSFVSGYEYKASSILDDMPKPYDVKAITQMFNAVGFSSPPSWLKPYDVLSNGEKMRVDLARAILENKSPIVFDEFTSVVDRNIAKIGSAAVAKSIRRMGRKFIAVSCHDDILEWLEPDWVFNTNTMEFKITRGLLQRPPINISVCEVPRSFWPLFRKYHYLNTELITSAKCFVARIGDVPAAFVAATRFVHPQVKNAMRGHRTVTLPDYQGVGIGVKLSDYVARMYVQSGEKYISTTSSPSMIAYRKKSPNWKCTYVGRLVAGNKTNPSAMSMKSNSSNRLVTSWEYVL